MKGIAFYSMSYPLLFIVVVALPNGQSANTIATNNSLKNN